MKTKLARRTFLSLSAQSTLLGITALSSTGALALATPNLAIAAPASPTPTKEDELLALAIDVYEASLNALAGIPVPGSPNNAFILAILDVYELTIFPGVFSILDFKIQFNAVIPEPLASLELMQFMRDSAEPIAAAELARLRAFFGSQPVDMEDFQNAVDLVAFAAALLPTVAIFRAEASKILGTLGFIHHRLLGILWTILNKIAENIPKAGDLYKKIFGGVHETAHATFTETAYTVDGGGKFLATNRTVCTLRVDLSGTGVFSAPSSFSDNSDIAGSLRAFNYLTRTLIQSVAFSFIQGKLLSNGDLVLNSTGTATVNGVLTNIRFDAVKRGGVVTFEVRNAETGGVLAGGTGEPGRATLSLTVTP
jgi:hypothetical protein